MTTVPLNATATITLDGSGNGTAKVGPTGRGVTWHPEVASLMMTGAVPTGLATGSVYAGTSATAENFIDATYSPSNDATDKVSGSEIIIGRFVWAVWSAGNANATATLKVTGTQEIP